MEKNIDYKEMYLKMVRASEEALNILIAAQRECEEIYQQQAEDGEVPDSQKGRPGFPFMSPLPAGETGPLPALRATSPGGGGLPLPPASQAPPPEGEA